MASFLSITITFVLIIPVLPFQLPRNYYPKHQNLDLVLETGNIIVGSTTIFVQNTNNLHDAPIVFNVYNESLKVTKMTLHEGWGNPEKLPKLPIGSSTYSFNTETYSIYFKNYKYNKLTLYIDFEAQINDYYSSSFGMFPIYNNWEQGKSDGLATQFQQSFARKAFPCFDDPYFRTIYQLKFTLNNEADENVKNKKVLFNSPLKTFDETEHKYTFEQTLPIPSYLVAFTVIDTAKHKQFLNMSYFGTPIALYSEEWHFDFWTPKDFERMEEIIRFTLSFCESKFLMPLDLKKIDIVVVNMYSSKIGAMEHPGLMTINDGDMESLIPTLIHEVIHQWTGVKVVNDWWSGFWINEGLTTFFQALVQYHLVVFNRIEKQALDTTFYMKNYKIHGNVGGVAQLGQSGFKQLTLDFYSQAGNAVGLLHVAMNDLLMKCLGLIMKDFPYSSLSTEFILEELTECPYSELNVTEFMGFWLFEDQTPILTVDCMLENNQPYFYFSYNFLKPIAEMKDRSDLFDEVPKKDPTFAVVFRDPFFNIIQPMTIITDNYTKVPAEFMLTEYSLFFINAQIKGNFINKYPKETYDAFFRWLNHKDTVKYIQAHSTPKHYSFFILDMFVLGYRGLIEPNLLFRLLEKQKMLMNLGAELWQSVQMIPNFVNCLQYTLDSYLESKNEQELRKLLKCYVCKIALYENCNNGYSQIDSCRKWVRLYGMQFMEDLKTRVARRGDKFSDCL